MIGGVRYEATQLGIVVNPELEVKWVPPGGGTGDTDLHPGDADVSFKRQDVLPSMGLTITPFEKVTLRGSYSQTVARQTFKELTPIIQSEDLGADVFIGNPTLEMSTLQNYDWRLDYTPYDGGLFSGSWFRKDIEGPIEYIQTSTSSFSYTTATNYPQGRILGLTSLRRARTSGISGTGPGDSSVGRAIHPDPF